MGDPRKLRNKYVSPRKIFDKNDIKRNKALLRKYGLKKTEEVWRAETILGRFRERARKLINTKNEEEEKALFNKLLKYGLITRDSTVDDILDLELEAILDRQLATVVVKLGLANTVKQARQFITHGHIVVDGQKITSPRYLVPVDKENKISFYENSKLKNSFKIKEVKEEEVSKDKGSNVDKNKEEKVKDNVKKEKGKGKVESGKKDKEKAKPDEKFKVESKEENNKDDVSDKASKEESKTEETKDSKE